MTRALTQRTSKEDYTTGQVARLLRVAPRTISKWVDSGVMKGYRLPGSNDRRVMRADLLLFMHIHQIPAAILGQPSLKILLAGVEPDLFAAMRAATPANGLSGVEVRLQRVETIFEAGMLTSTFQPDIVVLDLLNLGKGSCVQAAQILARLDRTTRVIALANEDQDPGELLAAGFHDVFRRPFDSRLLAEKLRAA